MANKKWFLVANKKWFLLSRVLRREAYSNGDGGEDLSFHFSLYIPTQDHFVFLQKDFQHYHNVIRIIIRGSPLVCYAHIEERTKEEMKKGEEKK